MFFFFLPHQTIPPISGYNGDRYKYFEVQSTSVKIDIDTCTAIGFVFKNMPEPRCLVLLVVIKFL